MCLFSRMCLFRRKKKKPENKANKPDIAVSNEPVQRRNYFRVVCNVRATIIKIQRSEQGEILSSEPYSTLICNMSGGGVRMLTNAQLEINDRILVCFKLNDDLLIQTGEVRVVYLNPNDDFQYEYGVMFKGMTGADQDKLYKYLFQEQTFYVLSEQKHLLE